MCVRVYTTPSPAHVYCPNARFSHKVRLKIDWKFLVRLLKCLSLTANKMAAKNNKKSQKQKSNAAATSHLWLQLSKEWERGRERERVGKRASWRLNSSTTRRLRRQLHLQLCLLSTSCGPRSVFVVCLCLSRFPLSLALLSAGLVISHSWLQFLQSTPRNDRQIVIRLCERDGKRQRGEYSRGCGQFN